MNIDRITLVEAVTNDSYLKELYTFKEKVISSTEPKIMFCKKTKQYEYIIATDLLQKIDSQITNRINQLKKAYDI